MLLSTEIQLFPDRTLFIQLGIFLAVVFSLNQFVFKPVLKILKLRRLRTEGDRKKIEEVAQKTQNLIKEYEAKMQEAKKEAFQIKEALRKEGHEQSLNIVQEARQASTAQIEKIKKEIAAAGSQATAQLESQAENLSRQIAEKVLGRPLDH